MTLQNDNGPDRGISSWLFALTVGVIVTILGAGWFNLNSQLTEMRSEIQSELSIIVPREVHVEKWAQTREEFQHVETEIKESLQRIENEIDKKASKDDLNRMAFDLLQKIEKKKS